MNDRRVKMNNMKRKKTTKKKTGKKTRRKNMGRPTIMSKELCDKIVSFVRAGNYIDVSVKASGVSKDTAYRWMKHGARVRRKANETGERLCKTDKLAAEFSDAIEKATAEAEAMDLLTIQRASRTQWQASAWRLERKHPDKWGRRERREHTGKDGGPIAVSHGLTDEQADSIKRSIFGMTPKVK